MKQKQKRKLRRLQQGRPRDWTNATTGGSREVEIRGWKRMAWAEANKLKSEAESIKASMEHEYRMKEIEIRNSDTGETYPKCRNKSK